MTSEPSEPSATVLPRVGETFKNYKTVCEAMGEKPVAGNPKIAQLKRWKLLFNWETSGQSWKILPLEPTSSLSSKEFVDNLQAIEVRRLLLLGCLLGCTSEEEATLQVTRVALSDEEIAEEIGLVNCRFKQIDKRDPELALFNYSIRTDNNKLIATVLGKLVEDKILGFRKTYSCKLVEGSKSFIADDSLNAVIDIVKHNALKALGVSTEYLAYTAKTTEKFNELVARELRDNWGISSYRPVREFTFTKYLVKARTDLLHKRVLKGDWLTLKEKSGDVNKKKSVLKFLEFEVQYQRSRLEDKRVEELERRLEQEAGKSLTVEEKFFKLMRESAPARIIPEDWREHIEYNMKVLER